MRPLSLYLLDLFFPAKCIYCDALLQDSASYTCPHCKTKYFQHTNASTPQAGNHFSHSVSAAWYEDEVRTAFLQYKFYQQKHLSEAFAPPLARVVKRYFSGRYELITWVPVSKERLKKRGYDQSRLLAEALALALEQPALSLLSHPKSNPPQSGLSSAQARKDNVKDCFLAPQPELIRGRHILLVDDVLTTGATLEEASSVLRAAGAETVLCATFCRTRPSNTTISDSDFSHEK